MPTLIDRIAWYGILLAVGMMIFGLVSALGS
jgi:hypothetical protein